MTVVDRQTGVPLFAYYREPDKAQVYQTGQDGSFTAENIADREVVISANGYEDRVVMITDTLRKIALEQRAIVIAHPVTITARRFPETENVLAEAVTVLDKQQLLQMSPRSTPEALIGSPGLWIQKTNHGGGSPIIRGLVGNQVLLMVDGIRMNNATYRYGPNQYLVTVDPALISSLEAVRGNGSVLYGSDALGGVINVISKKPVFNAEGPSWHGAANASWMDSGMEKSTWAEGQFSSKRLAVHSGFAIRDFGELRAGGSFGTLSPTGYNEWSTNTKVIVSTSAASLITAAFQHHQQNGVPRYDQVQFGGYQIYRFDPQIRQLGYLRWNTSFAHPLIKALQITAALNRSAETTVSQREGSQDRRQLDDDTKTYNVSIEAKSNIALNWVAQSGADFYADHVSSTGAIRNQDTNETTVVRGNYANGAETRNFAVFTNHAYTIDRFYITAGARYNAVSLNVQDESFGSVKITPSAFVWNTSVSYEMIKGLRLHAGANTGFRAPNVDDISRFGPVESTVFEIPSPTLAPEQSRNIEAGLKGATKSLAWSASAYRMKLRDLIDRVGASYQGLDSVDNRRVYQKQNVNEAEVKGAEGQLQWKVSNAIKVDGNVTYTFGENISKHEPMRRIPPLFGKVGATYAWANHIWIRADYLMATKQSRLAAGDRSDIRISSRLVDGKMPAWSVLNIYAGFEIKKISLSISLLNAFDKGYRIYASGVDGVGRSVKISATVSF